MPELFRRLKRELVRSPKKTAILAIGFLVAIFFWGRLLFDQDDQPTAAPAKPGVASASAAVASTEPAAVVVADRPAPTPTIDATGEPSWTELLAWMRSSLEEEQEIDAPAAGRDPFETTDPYLAAAKLTEDAEPEFEGDPAESSDPGRQVVGGIVPQGVLKIGGRYFARLAGQTLGPGDRFDPAGRTESSTGTEPIEDWIVVAVDGEGVTVRPSSGGETLRLLLRPAGVPGLNLRSTPR